MPIQRWSEQIWVAQVTRDPAFTEELDSLIGAVDGRKPLPNVVIDLTQVDYVNSSNLAQLLKLRKKLVDGNALLRLVGPVNQVWAVFLATGLDKVFEFTPDPMTALAQLQIAGETKG